MTDVSDMLGGSGAIAGGAGDKVEDLAKLIGLASRGADHIGIAHAAHLLRFRLSDFSHVVNDQGMYARLLQAAANTSLVENLVQNLPTVLHYIESSLQHHFGRGRRHRRPGLKTIVRSLVAAAKIAHVLRKAGHGLASLSRHASSPTHHKRHR